ncbi:MAG: class I SAM-dependent methyltransferase [Christensenellaceae bacterium]
MTKRLRVLASLLSEAELFADVGCDHGYLSEYMLERGLCRHAILSDVSRGSLHKAELLLKDYAREGRCSFVCADGLAGVPESVDLVLIAGMGGREIVGIFERGFLPKRFVLQPMRDVELVRRYLVEHGAKLERDFTFRDGKYYHAITGEAKGGSDYSSENSSDDSSDYSEEEFAFGKENLAVRGEDFLSYLTEEIERLRRVGEREMPKDARLALEESVALRERILGEKQ